MKITALILGIFFSSIVLASQVNLINGANYVTNDGTKVTCSATAINKQTYCLCSSNNNLVLQEVASNKFNYLKMEYPDQASCLEDLKNRPECK